MNIIVPTKAKLAVTKLDLMFGQNLPITLAAAGGCIRQCTANDDPTAWVKDIDIIVSSPMDPQDIADTIYKKVRLISGMEWIKMIDSYKSPRLLARGLAAIVKLDFRGTEVDVLLFEKEIEIKDIIEDFDMDCNMVAWYVDYDEEGKEAYGQPIYTEAFQHSMESKTYKLVNREKDECLMPRELERLETMLKRLPDFEPRDLQEMLEYRTAKSVPSIRNRSFPNISGGDHYDD